MSNDSLLAFQPIVWSRRRLAALTILFAAICFVGVAVYFLAFSRPAESTMRVWLGLNGSQQTRTALELGREATQRGLHLEYVTVRTSEDALRMVSQGELDVAIVRGGVNRDQPGVRQLMLAGREVVHVFTRTSSGATNAAEALRGRRVYLGEPQSEVREVAEVFMAFMGLQPGRDFSEVALPSPTTPADSGDWPDVVVEVGPLPSARSERWARDLNYALVALPMGDAMHLRDRTWESVEIPAMAYRSTPAVPAEPVSTVGCRLVVVAGQHVAGPDVRALLEVVYQSDFPRRLGLPPLDPAQIASKLEFPLHAGAVQYLERDRPLWTMDLLQRFQNLYAGAASLFCAGLLLFGWWRKLRAPRFETYLLRLAQLELNALRSFHDDGHLDTDAFVALRQQLLELRCELLEIVANSYQRPDDKVNNLLSRVNDVHASLDRLHAPAARSALRISA